MFSFKIHTRLPNTLARVGTIHTPHGDIQTPAFVTVGTKATVKALTSEQISRTGAQVVLANTYHLYLQPGDERIAQMGGFARAMGWSGPSMTDSGGFQVFSLGVAYGKELSKVVKPVDASLHIPERSSADDGVPRLATIGNDGVSFRSHIDGSLHYITPEKSMEIQANLGADIIFAFDECTSPSEDRRYQEEALHRTHAWAKRSLKRHHELQDSRPLYQALFGVVQGGRDEELRRLSARTLRDMTVDGHTFDGFGIGGSFDKNDLHTAVRWVNEELPEYKPRHLLGIGEPEDLFLGVENGIDLFDCVAPTRNARTGTLYTKNGKINIANTAFQDDYTPIESGCECYTCTHYTRAYVAHLFRAKEMLAGTLATIHNLYFIVHLVSDMRQALLNGNFLEMKESFLKGYLK